jgi:hypothetical protein
MALVYLLDEDGQIILKIRIGLHLSVTDSGVALRTNPQASHRKSLRGALTDTAPRQWIEEAPAPDYQAFQRRDAMESLAVGAHILGI